MYRCNICDYTVEDGSFFTNKSPSRLNQVHERHGEYMCDECASDIDDQQDYFHTLDEADE